MFPLATVQMRLKSARAITANGIT